MNKTNKSPDFVGIASKIKGEAARYAAVEAKKFFKECFVKGGWTDKSFQAWKARKSPVGRKLMYNEGSLMNSISTFQQTDDLVETGSKSVYAKIHNDGGTITVTPKMKKFFWAKYVEAAGIKKENGKTNWGRLSNIKTGENNSWAINKRNREVGGKASFYKAMALMPVGSKIKIPQRKFIGESATFMQQLDEWLKNTIETSIKNDLNTD